MTRIGALLFRALPIIVLAVVAVQPLPVQAQQITFDDAIRIALDNNYLLKRSANQVRLEEITVRQRRYAPLPNLSFSSGTGRNFGLQFDQTTGELYTETSDRFNLGVGSSLTLFNGLAEFALLKQSRLDLESVDYTFERQRQAIVFQVMSRFLTLIQQKEQVTIQEDNVEATQQQLTQIEEFVRVGSRPMSDLLQQRAVAANAELALLNAQTAVQLAEGSLIQTLQLDPFGTYEFVMPSEEDIQLIPEDYEIDELLRNAFDRRYDLRAQELAIGSSEQSLRVARAGTLPRLSLSGSAGTGYSSQARQLVLDDNGRPVLGPSGNPVFELTPFSTQLTNNRSQSLSLSLSIPLFNRFQTHSQIQRARVNVDNARLEMDNLQHQIGLEVRQAYLDYVSDEKRLDVTEKQLEAAEQALAAEQERYNVGASTLVELTQARAAYVNAAGNRATAKFSFLFRKRLIDYYIGALDPGRPLFE